MSDEFFSAVLYHDIQSEMKRQSLRIIPTSSFFHLGISLLSPVFTVLRLHFFKDKKTADFSTYVLTHLCVYCLAWG